MRSKMVSKQRCLWKLALVFLATLAWIGSDSADAFSLLTPRSASTSTSRQSSQDDALKTRPTRRISPTAPLSLATPPMMNMDPSVASTPAQKLSSAVLEFYSNLDEMYNRSMSIKCPFMRRRAADAIDGAAMMLQFLLIRHKSLPWISDLFLDVASSEDETNNNNNWMSILSAPGCKPLGRHIKLHPDGSPEKSRHLPLSTITEKIHRDWTGGSTGETKGYYITGKLDSTIYRDDCLFIGPDPDMPVRGLRKYLSAAAQLFDQRQSFAELTSIEYVEGGGEKGLGVVEVKWRLGGILMLPWHPDVEPWTGLTRYHMDEEGLVFLHEEEWDISVWRAFVCTLFPETREWFSRVGALGIII